jgi:UDP-N-acetylmuramate-alanine ligase
MGVDEDDFEYYCFKGASKRLEKIAESRTSAYKDFAHSPS